VATCEECGGPVNDAVVKCPHCGAKRDVGPAVYSKAEIRAILATDEAARANTDSTAMLKALLLPAHHTTGILRILELALAAVAAPAVLLGALGMFLFGRRRGFITYGPTNKERSQAMLSTTGELAPTVVMTIIGGGAFLMFGGEYAMLAITAMWARAAIRMISSGKHERQQIADEARAPNALPPAGPPKPRPSPPALPPARPSAPALPPARVVAAADGSSPVVAPSPVKAPEKAPEPLQPGDEPSILR
jgi:hypothetical protein